MDEGQQRQRIDDVLGRIADVERANSRLLMEILAVRRDLLQLRGQTLLSIWTAIQGRPPITHEQARRILEGREEVRVGR